MEKSLDKSMERNKNIPDYDVNPVAWIFTIILVSTAILLIYIDRAYYHFL